MGCTFNYLRNDTSDEIVKWYTVLPLSVCPSVCPSILPSFRPSFLPSFRPCPSKIFFIAFFSVTVDGRNLIFGHKCHIGTPYHGKRFWTHQIPTSCLLTVDFYTHWTYMHIFRHIFLSNYWWQKSDIWSQASYRYPISWETFLHPSDSYFLFADFVDFYTHLTYICICTFFVAFF
jgi:hypothetical protein